MRVGAVDVVFPADFPEHLVAAEKREVHARVPCSFHVLALLTGPVFIVADGEKQLMFQLYEMVKH